MQPYPLVSLVAKTIKMSVHQSSPTKLSSDSRPAPLQLVAQSQRFISTYFWPQVDKTVEASLEIVSPTLISSCVNCGSSINTNCT